MKVAALRPDERVQQLLLLLLNARRSVSRAEIFDYERAGLGRVALGIETKLTDSFSQEPYDRESYRRWMRSEHTPFREDAWDEDALPRHNQIWRNHLLAIALRDRGGLPYVAARSAVISHPLDTAGANVIASYRRLLRPSDDTFGVWAVDEVVHAFERAAFDDAERAWLERFRTRYLALELSEAEWRAR